MDFEICKAVAVIRFLLDARYSLAPFYRMLAELWVALDDKVKRDPAFQREVQKCLNGS